MSPIYLVIGLLNIYAKSNNYGIKLNNTEMDIRVRRDTHQVRIMNYIQDNLREKRELQFSEIETLNIDRNRNYSTTHNRTSHKRGSHNHGMYIPRTRTRHHKSHDYQPDSTRNKPDNLELEIGYNQARLHKRQSLPTPQAYSNPETTTSRPFYKKIFSFLSGSKTTTPKYGSITPGVRNNPGVSGKLRKRKRKIIPACILCDTGCPVGYVRQESYCVSVDPDYE